MEQEIELQSEGDVRNEKVKVVPQIPKWLVIVLLLFFPPAAWYFMWKEKRYHSWFPILVSLYGGLMFIVSFLQVFIVIPKILREFEKLNMQIPSYNMIFVYSLFAISLAQFVFGVYVWRKVKVVGELSKSIFVIILIILVFNYLVTAFNQLTSVYSVILPIYSLTSEL